MFPSGDPCLRQRRWWVGGAGTCSCSEARVNKTNRRDSRTARVGVLKHNHRYRTPGVVLRKNKCWRFFSTCVFNLKILQKKQRIFKNARSSFLKLPRSNCRMNTKPYRSYFDVTVLKRFLMMSPDIHTWTPGSHRCTRAQKPPRCKTESRPVSHGSVQTRWCICLSSWTFNIVQFTVTLIHWDKRCLILKADMFWSGFQTRVFYFYR